MLTFEWNSGIINGKCNLNTRQAYVLLSLWFSSLYRFSVGGGGALPLDFTANVC